MVAYASTMGRCRSASGTAAANRTHSFGNTRPTSWLSHWTSRRDVVVNESEHERLDALRMRLGIGERESGSPKGTENRPALDPVAPAQPLDLGDEMSSGVRAQGRVLLVGQRPAAPAPSLVEEDYAVSVGIEETSLARGAA